MRLGNYKHNATKVCHFYCIFLTIDIQIRTVATAENEMAFFGTSTDDMIVPPRLMIPASRLQAIADINGESLVISSNCY